MPCQQLVTEWRLYAYIKSGNIYSSYLFISDGLHKHTNLGDGFMECMNVKVKSESVPFKHSVVSLYIAALW